MGGVSGKRREAVVDGGSRQGPLSAPQLPQISDEILYVIIRFPLTIDTQLEFEVLSS